MILPIILLFIVFSLVIIGMVSQCKNENKEISRSLMTIGSLMLISSLVYVVTCKLLKRCMNDTHNAFIIFMSVMSVLVMSLTSYLIHNLNRGSCLRKHSVHILIFSIIMLLCIGGNRLFFMRNPKPYMYLDMDN